MKSIRSGLRFFLTVCLCAVMLFATVAPAIAAPIKGEATHPAKEYEQTAKDAIDQGGPKSLDEVIDRQAPGSLNDIQGTTGIEQQKRPDNSRGETIEQKIKKGLDKVEEKVQNKD